MGEMVGKVYVEKHFPQKSKDEMDKLIENLRAAFKDGIDNLEWMDDKTKVEAQDKLAKFNPKIVDITDDKAAARLDKLMTDLGSHGIFGARPRKEAIITAEESLLCLELSPLHRSDEIGS